MASALGDAWRLLRNVAPVLGRALRRGQLWNPSCTVTPAHPDILCEYDVRIPVSDGFHVTADVFRSKAAAERGEPLPVVMCAHPYDNGLTPARGRTPLGGPPQQYRVIPQEGKPVFSELTSWEAPDPNFWVPSGYAVVNMNLPGFATSEGPPGLVTAAQGKAYYDAIEWVAAQPWCTGRVGLNGVSFLAISQYLVAACEAYGQAPPSLCCISPWEGVADIYRELLCPGGVREVGFPLFWWYSEVKPVVRSVEALVEAEGSSPLEWHDVHPTFDAHMQAKVPHLEAITVPMLVCASFSDQGVHNPGSFTAFMRASSAQKWMYTHRSLKWDVYYGTEVQQLTKRFFDCFVAGTDDGFRDVPPVRLEVRESRDVIRAVRHEPAWPLPQTVYERLYLDAGERTLAPEPPATPAEVVYPATDGRAVFRHRFDVDTELTGHMALRLWVEVRPRPTVNAADLAQPDYPDDLLLCVAIDKRDEAGRSVRFYGSVGNDADMVTRGFLAASSRALDEVYSTPWRPVPALAGKEPLAPGEVVAVDVELYPSSTFFRAGSSIDLIVSPREIVPSPPFQKDLGANRGFHVIHTGGDRTSWLSVPRIPA